MLPVKGNYPNSPHYFRIRGLVDGATEVLLQLLTTNESIDMLVAMAELDSVQPAVVKVVHLCGRLPLTVGLAAGMIKKYGTGWEDAVVGMLTDDFAICLAKYATKWNTSRR